MKKDQPSDFLGNDKTANLILEIFNSGDSRNCEPVVCKAGRYGGTYVCEELVYAYAMWISPSFHLKVIRVFKEYATKGMVMKPEVAQQAFDDPKAFMAKALMLAQEIKGLGYTNATLSSH